MAHSLIPCAAGLLPLLLAACGGPPATPARAAAAPVVTAVKPGGDAVPAPALRETTSHLLDALDHSDEAVRDDALELLALREDPEAVTALTLRLTDANKRVREETVDALADAGTATARALLEIALYDPHPAVREAALDGLATY